jgi:hypothetical protein
MFLRYIQHMYQHTITSSFNHNPIYIFKKYSTPFNQRNKCHDKRSTITKLPCLNEEEGLAIKAPSCEILAKIFLQYLAQTKRQTQEHKSHTK